MKIYHVLQIGQHHINHCEDFLAVANLGKSTLLCAVMDGCSMGTDSYFAATLTGKLLRKIADDFSYRELREPRDISLKEILKEITRDLFKQFRECRNMLRLPWQEVLSTLLIAIIDTEGRNAELLCVGDGLICINNKLYEFEQDNRPDYLGYHLDKDFEEWYNAQKQTISAQRIDDLSLSTDGIFTFMKYDSRRYGSHGDVIQLLLINREYADNTNMLAAKLMDIKNNWGLMPADDLAVVRVIW